MMGYLNDEEENLERLNRCMDEFDPNAQADHSWAVYKPDVTPHWKVYRTRGNALQCLGWGWPGVIYQKQYDGRWAEVTRVTPNLRHHIKDCQICNKQLENPYWYGRKFIWVGQPDLRLMVCCDKCYEPMNGRKIDDRYV